jgi:hypothetical protein
MPDRKEQELDVKITGSVDSSLARALGVTEAELAKLKDAVNTITARPSISREVPTGIPILGIALALGRALLDR